MNRYTVERTIRGMATVTQTYDIYAVDEETAREMAYDRIPDMEEIDIDSQASDTDITLVETYEGKKLYEVIIPNGGYSRGDIVYSNVVAESKEDAIKKRQSGTISEVIVRDDREEDISEAEVMEIEISYD